MCVLFDKDGDFIAYSDDFPDLPNTDIFKLELTEETSDLSKWEWKGNMFNGKMVKKNIEK
jgi:hypothetical protein